MTDVAEEPTALTSKAPWAPWPGRDPKLLVTSPWPGLDGRVHQEAIAVAHLPCTACRRMNPRGRNSGVYCHLWNGGVQHDFRLRLCAKHLTAFENDLAKYEIVSVDDTDSIIATPSQCFADGKPTLESDWHLSITAYPAKDQRKDYWTRLHTDCSMPEWGQNGQPLS